VNVAVIGGGASGILTVKRLVDALREAGTSQGVSIDIFEKQAERGGLAYQSSQDSTLTMNGPISNMSAFKEDPEHLHRWLSCADRRRWPDGLKERTFDLADYCPRVLFRLYLEDILDSAIAEGAAAGVYVRTLEEEVLEVDRSDSRTWRLVSRFATDGGIRHRDYSKVVLASGHLDPALPDAVSDVLSKPGARSRVRVVDCPAALSRICSEVGSRARVMVLGCGLTAVDFLHLRYKVNHHEGPTVVLARESRLPVVYPDGFRPEISRKVQPKSAGPAHPEAVLEWLTEELDTARRDGHHPEQVFRVLRKEVARKMEGWSLEAKQRFLPRYRKLDLFRTGMPPGSGRMISKLMNEDRLAFTMGEIRTILLEEDGVRVEMTSGLWGEYDALVACTGFSFDVQRTRHPVIRGLLSRHRIKAHPLELGIQVDPELRAAPGLYAVGPLIQGFLFETRGELGTGQSIVGIRAQAVRVGRSIAREIMESDAVLRAVAHDVASRV
jgi:uncharacterized NAD(P)/FAD-binding protein YdhS